MIVFEFVILIWSKMIGKIKIKNISVDYILILVKEVVVFWKFWCDSWFFNGLKIRLVYLNMLLESFVVEGNFRYFIVNF